MSITTPDNDARIQYTATASQTVFPYDFPINAEGDLVVIKEGATLTLTTDYTVSGVGQQSGGNVTLTSGATLNDVVTIYRDEAIARTSNFNVAGDFLAGTINDQLNSIVRWGQQLERDINRVVQLDPQDSAGSVTLPLTADRQGKFLAFDSSGDPIAAAGTVGDSPIPVSPFMETMLDDANAAAARTTLGLGTLATQSGTFSGTHSGTSSGTNTGDQNLFSTIAVSGQSNVVADTASDTLTLVAGTNITITTDAGSDSITINAASAGIQLQSAVATTSGTSKDFTSIPVGVKRITVMLDGVSTNGSSNIMVQIGNSGGIENTGYKGSARMQSSDVGFTTGFGITGGITSSNVHNGVFTLTLMNSATNTWAWGGTVSLSGTAAAGHASGVKSLSATLDRLRITMVNGTDAFDAGSASIAWEF